MNRAVAFARKNILAPARVNLFLFVNILLALVLIVLLYIRLKNIVLTALFSIIVFAVRLFRQRLSIPITLEPVILFSAVAVRAFGLSYGIFIACVPILLSDILSGRFRSGTLISVLCKVLVLLPVYYFGHYSMFAVTIASYVILNEGLGTLLALRGGSELTDVLTQLSTSTIIRIVYLQLFLSPLCGITGISC